MGKWWDHDEYMSSIQYLSQCSRCANILNYFIYEQKITHLFKFIGCNVCSCWLWDDVNKVCCSPGVEITYQIMLRCWACSGTEQIGAIQFSDIAERLIEKELYEICLCSALNCMYLVFFLPIWSFLEISTSTNIWWVWTSLCMGECFEHIEINEFLTFVQNSPFTLSYNIQYRKKMPCKYHIEEFSMFIKDSLKTFWKLSFFSWLYLFWHWIYLLIAIVEFKGNHKWIAISFGMHCRICRRKRNSTKLICK